ncbi:hypothetical protein WYH_03100 [Croceibacterium atlanticum]|uniref:Uncharacterized protein n=2 Tax=Croceibacterium atlanticum TaxID=1267766 RepID=A0A0F7KWS5_9SPHN|nr:hypothetical protein WYH_03100 [Croceibacterium atlanticum]
MLKKPNRPDDEANPAASADGFHAYRLKVLADAIHEETEYEFLAMDAYQALVEAREHASDRRSELFRDGKLICALQFLPSGMWKVDPPIERMTTS